MSRISENDSIIDYLFTQRFSLHWPLSSVIYRGYLIFSVQDRFLFHRMNTKSCIFTSGEATSENTAFGVHE